MTGSICFFRKSMLYIQRKLGVLKEERIPKNYIKGRTQVGRNSRENPVASSVLRRYSD